MKKIILFFAVFIPLIGSAQYDTIQSYHNWGSVKQVINKSIRSNVDSVADLRIDITTINNTVSQQTFDISALDSSLSAFKQAMYDSIAEMKQLIAGYPSQDTSAPILTDTSLTPTIDGFQFTFTSNELGYLFYENVLSDSSVTSFDSISMVSGTNVINYSDISILEFTDYDLHYFARDNRGNYIDTIQVDYTTSGLSSLTSGLIAYYPFNGNADDSSYNEFNGTVHGASLTTDRYGNENSAYEFDGNDYIDLNHDITTLEGTFAFWVWPDTSNDRTILSDDNDYFSRIYMTSSNLSYESNTNGQIYSFYGDGISLEEWNFFSIKRSNDTIYFRINGDKFYDTGTIDSLTISTISSTGAKSFIGKIDDIRIYDRALSETELDTLYNRRVIPVLPDSVICDTCHVELWYYYMPEPAFDGNCDGRIVIRDVHGLTAPLEYKWSTGSTSDQINNLCAGTYTLTVMDVDSFFLVDTFLVTEGSENLPYLATFENGTKWPERGFYRSGEFFGGKLINVPNPSKETRNNSDRVLMSTTPVVPIDSINSAHRRAEFYISGDGEIVTNNKHHTIMWSAYYPNEFLTVDSVWYDWMYLNQFSTSPCQKFQIWGGYPYGEDSIAYDGAIFNDHKYTNGNDNLNFRLRALPDSAIVNYSIPRGEWINYVYDVFWTTADTGYINIYINDTLVYSAENIKTLPGGWVEGECDIDFSIGQYTRWWDAELDSQYYYFDDIKIFVDTNLIDVCPSCEGVQANINDSYVEDQRLITIKELYNTESFGEMKLEENSWVNNHNNR